MAVLGRCSLCSLILFNNSYIFCQNTISTRLLRSRRIRPCNKLKGKQSKLKNLIKEEEGKKEFKKPITIKNQYLRLSNTVTPLWQKPYEVQLEMKYKLCLRNLKQFSYEMKKVKCKVFDSSGLPCALKPIIPSPVINGYRNKDEFSIRPSPDGNSKTLGFFIGSPAKFSNVLCVNPDHLLNIKDCHKKVVQDFQHYIDNSSLEACVDFNKGHWRNFIVRSNIHNEIMAIIIMHPQHLTQEELQNEKNKLTAYFSNRNNQEYNLKSLYFQACRHTRCTHQQSPFELLHGSPYIIEELKHMKFQISPESFFQVNTAAADILFNTIKKLSGVQEHSTVLDICCGTGTIGLSLAENVKRIIGIESSTQAIEDAIANARLNEITNASFFSQKVEIILPNLLSELYADDLIVILNPARGGLTNSVIRTLRNCKHLRRIIYISCKPKGKAMENFVQLCQPPPKKYTLVTEPFTPTLATPVDMFPHTNHYELIIVFERL